MKKPSSSKIVRIAILGIILIGIVFVAIALSNPQVMITKNEKVFLEKIVSTLSRSEQVSLKVVNPGDWNCAHPVAVYTSSKTVASKALGIPESDIIFLNAESDYVFEDMWGIIFTYPPNRVEYFKIPTNKLPYRGGVSTFKCTPKENAILHRTPIIKRFEGDIGGVELIEK